MDPNTNLEEQRSLVRWIIAYPDEDTSNEANRLAELAQAMDDWISCGGALPEEWENAQGS